jgi:hypothetical protein
MLLKHIGELTVISTYVDSIMFFSFIFSFMKSPKVIQQMEDSKKDVYSAHFNSMVSVTCHATYKYFV